MTLKLFSIKKIFRFTVVLISVLVQRNSFAQQNFILYNMRSVPQSIYANPAFRPTDTTIFVGIPVFSSQYFSFSNSGFRYSDLIKHGANDSLYADPNNMLSKLATKNYISLNYQMDLFSFGIGIKKNYFTFNVTEKATLRFGYTSEFMGFLWYGNGDPSIINKTINLAPSINFTHYREYGFGWSRKINDKLTVGGKLKYLYGMENVSTENSNVSIYTDPNDFALTAQSNVHIDESGIDSNEFHKPFNVAHYLFKKQNNGMGIDLGGTYKFNDRITFSASIVDLGFIHWNSAVSNYVSHTPGATFTYNGVNYNQFIGNNSINIGNALQKTGDSIAHVLKPDTLHNSYTTMLTTQIYVGANYQVIANGNAGILLYAQLYDNALHPAVALSYNQSVGKWLSASISYSIYNRSYTDIGLGFSVHLGATQLYIVSDNILGAIFPQDAKNINLHAGLNLVWAHKKHVTKASFN